MNIVKFSVKYIACLLFCLSFISATIAYDQDSQVLLTIEDEKISVEEFLNIYQKNNVKSEPIDRESLEEYLKLFINFKLKVKEAEALGLDTVSDFLNELQGYRAQLAQTLLRDDEVTEKLIKEAYQRLQEDVRASHILIRVDRNALPQDTLEVYNRIMELRRRIIQGGESFAHIARESSEDESARDRAATSSRPAIQGNAGDLGYFTAFDMVYPFESAAYNTEVGEISMPVRTNFGYHIIKVTDRKPAMGRVQAAHILKSVPANDEQELEEQKRKEIYEVYQKIKEGKPFGEMAKKYSDDKGSGANGGLLPWFGVSRMVPEFITTISNLEINQMSEPIRTMYGYHIIKLHDREEQRSFEDMYAELKSRVSRDPRANLSQKLFIKRIKDAYAFDENKNALKEFYKVVDDSIFHGTWSVENAAHLTKELFTIGSKTYTQQDFANYLYERQNPRSKTNIKGYINNLYQQFVDDRCLAYEDSRLEEKYPEFRALMKEYRDGILLFELTDQRVWSKAVTDTAGIEKFYETIRHKYMWPERLNASIYFCEEGRTVRRARRQVNRAARRGIPNEEVLAKLNEKNPEAVKIESGFFVKGDNKIIDAIKWQEGLSNNVNKNGRTAFVYVHEILEPEPKALSEIRGLVTAAYQNHLEKLWVEELRRKYSVVVNEDAFKSILEKNQ